MAKLTPDSLMKIKKESLTTMQNDPKNKSGEQDQQDEPLAEVESEEAEIGNFPGNQEEAEEDSLEE
jgi:hypothetical protein